MTWHIYSKSDTGRTERAVETDASARENIQIIRRSKAYTTVLDIENVVLIWHRARNRDDLVVYL